MSYDDFTDAAQEVEDFIKYAKSAAQKGPSAYYQLQISVQKAQTAYYQANYVCSRLKGAERTTANNVMKRMQIEIADLQGSSVSLSAQVSPSYTAGPNKQLAEANAYLGNTDQHMNEANVIAGDIINALDTYHSKMKETIYTTNNIVGNTAKANVLTKEMQRKETMVNWILYGIDIAIVALDCLGFWIFHHNVKTE